MQPSTKTTKAPKTKKTTKSTRAATKHERTNGAPKPQANGAAALPTTTAEASSLYAVRVRVGVALQHLDLLSWALYARLDDVEEFETFSKPMVEMRRELHALCEEFERSERAS